MMFLCLGLLWSEKARSSTSLKDTNKWNAGTVQKCGFRNRNSIHDCVPNFCYFLVTHSIRSLTTAWRQPLAVNRKGIHHFLIENFAGLWFIEWKKLSITPHWKWCIFPSLPLWILTKYRCRLRSRQKAEVPSTIHSYLIVVSIITNDDCEIGRNLSGWMIYTWNIVRKTSVVENRYLWN